ncbi:MAG: hypothetical protein KAR39_12355 [Thermoplasmata archaeon]|nr:hypothetical protein [Thermoplasmata archaeon]
MISCTVGDVVNSIPALTRLQDEKLHIKMSLHIRRVFKLLEEEHETYLEERKKLIDRHAWKDDKGNLLNPPLLDEKGVPVVDEDGEPVLDKFKVNIDDIDAFKKDVDELLNVDISLPIKPLPLSGLMAVKISANDIGAILCLFEDDVIIA